MRVEEVVVDAAVDHVDPPRALRRAHEDEVVLDEQVLPLDQLDAHLLRQEGVLEVGAVVHAGRQHARPSGRWPPAGATARSVSSSRSG